LELRLFLLDVELGLGTEPENLYFILLCHAKWLKNSSGNVFVSEMRG